MCLRLIKTYSEYLERVKLMHIDCNKLRKFTSGWDLGHKVHMCSSNQIPYYAKYTERFMKIHIGANLNSLEITHITCI